MVRATTPLPADCVDACQVGVGGTPFLVLNEYFYQPSFKLLEELVLDDLKRKYTGEKVEKYEGIAEEQLAISWYRQQLQDDPTAEIG